MTTRALIPNRFDLVDEEGNEAVTWRCPFCGAHLTIGFVAGAPRDGIPMATHAGIHGTIGDDNLTGCDVFDRLELGDFLSLAVPRLLAAAALEVARRHRGRT